MTISKELRLQLAADDVGVIAETVETLHKLLDKFHSEHGQELYDRVEKAWPDAYRIASAKPLYDLEQKLTPPEDR
jgi:hypothetical protein